MIKLLRLHLFLFGLSFVGVGVIRVCVILFILLTYQGHYLWGMADVTFVLKQGSLLGFVFCIFAMVVHVKNRK
jgi:hypothetical protein